MKNPLECLRQADIDNALEKEYRQYLTGHLQRPQVHLQHIEDDIEIGISHYDAFTPDKPHMHPVATEHGYILEGSIKLLLIHEWQEYLFSKGDFFAVKPGVAYATKNAPGTRVLFTKAPGLNDKTPVPLTEALSQWLSAWDPEA